MFRKNDFLSGLILGILLPAVVFFMLFSLFNLLGKIGGGDGIGLSESFRERTSAILAIAVNLVPMNAFRRQRFDQSIRGVVVATGLLALAWVVYYGMKIL